jgi:hypothetical protein
MERVLDSDIQLFLISDTVLVWSKTCKQNLGLIVQFPEKLISVLRVAENDWKPLQFNVKLNAM